MARRTRLDDSECAIAQALDVVGDWWSLLVLRDVARGLHRFEELRAELGVSRKVLTERLVKLTDAGVLARRQYSDRPPRSEYVLTDLGRGALPVLVALQEWGDTWLLGDGSTSATTEPGSAEAQRVRALVGTKVEGFAVDSAFTVLYCYPGTGMPGAGQIPGAAGCTLEACTFRDRLDEFAALGAAVSGLSTQLPSEQAAFAKANRIRFPLLSDAGLELTTALRLPTFRAGGTVRLKRLTLVLDATATVRGVLYPIQDVTGGVEDAFRMIKSLT
ncbi:winged helix-turn-helix transcriptional regulator [Longispora albida]|uniref:winged helix-turn-helix transcriptional regulator n=1 Tax=Longispora albida TaxID=203523 RepID=UPI000370AFEB|nr:winged helix-turn-helix transcriptional regulator [Longispora albida]